MFESAAPNRERQELQALQYSMISNAHKIVRQKLSVMLVLLLIRVFNVIYNVHFRKPLPRR